MRFLRLSVFLWIGICSAAVAAPATQPSTQPIEIPYRISDSNHIVVRVKINGQGPFNFIVDTGAPAMIVRIPVGTKVGLKPTTRGLATMDKLEIEGGAKLTHVQCIVETPYQIEGMNAIGAGGVELDGMMGYSILSRFRMQIDFTKDRMIWTPVDYTPPDLPERRQRGGEPDAAEMRLESMGGILKFLGPFVKQKQLPPKYRGLLGIELAQSDGKVSILRVLGGSSADKAGLIAGDELQMINDRSVKSIADAQSIVLRIEHGQPARLTVHRGDATLKLKITSGEGL